MNKAEFHKAEFSALLSLGDLKTSSKDPLKIEKKKKKSWKKKKIEKEKNILLVTFGKRYRFTVITMVALFQLKTCWASTTYVLLI